MCNRFQVSGVKKEDWVLKYIELESIGNRDGPVHFEKRQLKASGRRFRPQNDK